MRETWEGGVSTGEQPPLAADRSPSERCASPKLDAVIQAGCALTPCNRHILKPKIKRQFSSRALRLEGCCCPQRDSEIRAELSIPEPAKLPTGNIRLSGSSFGISRCCVTRSTARGLGSDTRVMHVLPASCWWGTEDELGHPPCPARLTQRGSKSCVWYRARCEGLTNPLCGLPGIESPAERRTRLLTRAWELRPSARARGDAVTGGFEHLVQIRF